MRSFDILPGLKAEDSRIRLYSCFEPKLILFADAAEMFAASPVHGLMQMAWFFSMRTGLLQAVPNSHYSKNHLLVSGDTFYT